MLCCECILFRDVEEKVEHKTLNEKCQALKDIDKGLSNKDAFIKYGVPPNTISNLIKNKDKCLKALDDNRSSKKPKFRESNFDELDSVVLRWYLSKRSQNVPIDDNLIKEKARMYAKNSVIIISKHLLDG